MPLLRATLPAAYQERIAMQTEVEVKSIVFRTHADGKSERRLVAIMTNGKVYRFNEGKMRAKLIDCSLSGPTLRAIENAAYERALEFHPHSRSRLVAQQLLCEFQTEFEDIYYG